MSAEEKIKELEEKVLYYESDHTKRGYFSLSRIVGQQINLLNSFNLREEIIKNPKDDKYYDRVKTIWEGLKTMILDLKELKVQLKIGDEQSEDDVNFIETIAQQRK